MNYFTFRTAPTLPIFVGGALIVIGGLIVTLWESHHTHKAKDAEGSDLCVLASVQIV